mmetsp:Transcript_19679/g.52996  ORF Transcript_19679/g.52996 Transcript_19679/m.52996 type:complete len:478 (+) Transcript_19679:49-1482(+)
MGNACKAGIVEREIDVGAAAPGSAAGAGGLDEHGADVGEILQAREQQYQEETRRLKQQVRDLEEELRNQQAFMEDVLANKNEAEGGGGEGHRRSGGAGDDEVLAEALGEADRLREHVQQLERDAHEAPQLREQVEEMERRIRELEEELEHAVSAEPTQPASPPGPSREVIALQAERRALADEKAALNRALEEKQQQLEEAEERARRWQSEEKSGVLTNGLQEKAKEDDAKLETQAAMKDLEAQLAELREENAGLQKKCQGLAELAEQACARAEQVAQKFEQAEQLRDGGEDTLVCTSTSSVATLPVPSALAAAQIATMPAFGVEGRPVAPAPMASGGGGSLAGGVSTGRSNSRPLPASRILQQPPSVASPLSSTTPRPLAATPLSGSIRAQIHTAPSPIGSATAAAPMAARPISPSAALHPGVLTAPPRPVRGTGLDASGSGGGDGGYRYGASASYRPGGMGLSASSLLASDRTVVS